MRACSAQRHSQPLPNPGLGGSRCSQTSPWLNVTLCQIALKYCARLRDSEYWWKRKEIGKSGMTLAWLCFIIHATARLNLRIKFKTPNNKYSTKQNSKKRILKHLNMYIQKYRQGLWEMWECCTVVQGYHVWNTWSIVHRWVVKYSIMFRVHPPHVSLARAGK